MLESFFAARSSQCSATEAVPPITLLSGPSSCGKTSILFQFAINRALESRGNVVFICNKRKLEYKPPFLSQDSDPSADVLERIEMKYIEDYDGITKYFAAFHLHKTFPAAIIIDDFEDHFIDRTCKQRYGNLRGRDLAMARCLALCRDAILHANQKLETQASCKLLFADTHQGDNPRLLFIYTRWVHCILTIHGDVHGFFILKNSNILSNALETRRAKYSIALQSLLLEAILESPAKNDKQSCALVFSVHNWPSFSKDQGCHLAIQHRRHGPRITMEGSGVDFGEDVPCQSSYLLHQTNSLGVSFSLISELRAFLSQCSTFSDVD